MIELVIITCLAGEPCKEHTYGELFASHAAWSVAAQPLAAAFLTDHPQYHIAGIVCRPPQKPGIDT
jgi:hypothetical protein